MLDYPALVRKLVLSGTGPGVGNEDPDIAQPKAKLVAELATKDPDLEAMATLFFYPSESSRAAAVE